MKSHLKPSTDTLHVSCCNPAITSYEITYSFSGNTTSLSSDNEESLELVTSAKKYTEVEHHTQH